MAHDQKGYATGRRDGRLVRMHRWYWEQENGPIPDGMQMDHLCLQKPCVNPSHLEVVSSGENTRRANKLTKDDVREVRALAAAGIKQRVIGGMFDLDQSAVSRIVRGERQREVI